MAVLGPDFPKCPVSGNDMASVALKDVPQKARQEMARYGYYQRLDPNYWYCCEECNIYLHKLAIKRK